MLAFVRWFVRFDRDAPSEHAISNEGPPSKQAHTQEHAVVVIGSKKRKKTSVRGNKRKEKKREDIYPYVPAVQ